MKIFLLAQLFAARAALVGENFFEKSAESGEELTLLLLCKSRSAAFGVGGVRQF